MRRLRHSAPPALAGLCLVFCLAACGPSDPLERARLLQEEERDFAASLEILRPLVEEQPDDAEAQFRYALALIATGQESLAKWPLRRAMESDEWLEQAGITLAHTMLSLYRTDEAVQVTDQVLEKNPENVDALVLRASARVRTRRDYEGALEDANRALELDPENLPALIPRTAALLGLERVEEAAEALEQLEAVYRDDTLGLHGSSSMCAARATFLQEKGDLAKAEERFEACYAQFSEDPLMLAEVIKFFDSIDRRDRAEEILTEALAARPEDGGLRSALIGRLEAENRDEEAEALLRAATELETPELASAGWYALAHYQLEHGDVKAASEAFERALALDPGRSPELVFGYADGLVMAGRHDEALALAAEMNVPAHALLVRGRVALAQGEPREALQHFTEANRIWPNNAVARYYTAAAAEQLGDFRRAVDDYRYSMRIDTKATDAYLRLARLHLAAGQREAALQALSFQPGGRPAEEEASLTLVELLAAGDEMIPPPLLDRLARAGRRGDAAAAVARGLRQRMGAEAAVEFLRLQPDLDLAAPENAGALHALVALEAERGRAKPALAEVKEAVRASPESAALHAVHGLALEAAGADAAQARAAYRRALELDPDEPRALAALARLEESAGDAESALALYTRAAEAHVDDRDSARAAAALLARAGRGEEAEARLEALLRHHPYDAEAAVALAELRVARGLEDRTSRELLRRALGFGAGERAEALRAKLGVEAPVPGAIPSEEGAPAEREAGSGEGAPAEREAGSGEGAPAEREAGSGETGEEAAAPAGS